MNTPNPRVLVRQTQPRDFPAIGQLTRKVYPCAPPWSGKELASHMHVFPEGQYVAVDTVDGSVVGMDSSLIIDWHHYHFKDNWKEFTAGGMFTNHDPKAGQTLYAAEIMVDPDFQHHGVGGLLYAQRRTLVQQFNLLRIRAGARLRGYAREKDRLSPHKYVLEVIHGRREDPTLTFQLHEGFHVLAVVANYLADDPESLGYAAVIEWLNPALAQPHHSADRDARYIVPRPGV